MRKPKIKHIGLHAHRLHKDESSAKLIGISSLLTRSVPGKPGRYSQTLSPERVLCSLSAGLAGYLVNRDRECGLRLSRAVVLRLIRAATSEISTQRTGQVNCSLSGGGKKLSVRRAERKGRIGHLSCRGVTSEPWRVHPVKQARRSKASHHHSRNRELKSNLLTAVAGQDMKQSTDYREHSAVEATLLPFLAASSPTATHCGVFTVFFFR